MHHVDAVFHCLVRLDIVVADELGYHAEHDANNMLVCAAAKWCAAVLTFVCIFLVCVCFYSLAYMVMVLCFVLGNTIVITMARHQCDKQNV